MSWSCGENSEELMGLRGVYLMAVHKWCSLMIRESLLLRLEYLHKELEGHNGGVGEAFHVEAMV